MQYRQAIENELTKLDQTEFRPYGTGGDQQNAPIIATGEMWGNHCEYIFTNRHYGNGGANGSFFTGGFTARLQGQDFENQPNGLNAYLNAIESFNPNLVGDVHRWIPQGLCYDLFDNRNDNSFSVNLPIDRVSGYTAQQCFNALQPDVRSIPAFGSRLLQQNGNNQQAQVIQLFNQYGY